mgnify:CR=1 FL=1
MAKVMILCGKVAAGKTTFAKQHDDHKTVVLSIDELAIRLQDHCQGPQTLQVLEKNIRAYDCLLMKQLINKGMDCILDHGHWSRESRKEVIQFCETHKMDYEIVWLRCPKRIRLQRLLKRNEILEKNHVQGYLIDQEKLERFDQWFEELTDEEKSHARCLCFDEKSGKLIEKKL